MPTIACPIGIPITSVPPGAVGVLSGGMSARLFTEVREKRGLCYTVFASHSHAARSGMCSVLWRVPARSAAQETLDVTLGETAAHFPRDFARGAGAAEGQGKKRADHAGGIELFPQRRNCPRLVSFGSCPNAC